MSDRANKTHETQQVAKRLIAVGGFRVGTAIVVPNSELQQIAFLKKATNEVVIYDVGDGGTNFVCRQGVDEFIKELNEAKTTK